MSPQEASMMMQLLKLAGVQPVDQADDQPRAGNRYESNHTTGGDQEHSSVMTKWVHKRWQE